ncbi:MAG TPA: aminoglycoside phosphotransferase family protein [Nitrolancea sp.]
MHFTFPDHFVRIQTELQGADGLEWLASLPSLVDDCARRWNLTVDGMMDPLTYNFLVSTRLQNGRPVVLKLCPPNGEFASQRSALRHFAGRGAIQLLDDDETNGILLLERCVPGESLHKLSDIEAIEIAGSIMRLLWKPPPDESIFPALSDWGKGFGRLRRYYEGTGPFPPVLLDRAEQTFAALGEQANDVVLLHGDLHHGNILTAQREPWLAIDPKGVLGVPAYEPATFVINQTAEAAGTTDLSGFLMRRVDGLAAAAALDPIEVREWAIAHAVLSAWWTVEDHGRVGDFALTCAEALASD